VTSQPFGQLRQGDKVDPEGLLEPSPVGRAQRGLRTGVPTVIVGAEVVVATEAASNGVSVGPFVDRGPDLLALSRVTSEL
jgi:hypothetical protein